jgi:hypothetical protein
LMYKIEMTLNFSAMKKMFIMLCVAFALVSGHTAWAHTETEATARLKSSFSKSFTGASNIKWYTDDNKLFTAKFTVNGTSVSAYFDADGNLLATRRYITETQLPLAVSTSLHKRFPKDKVSSAVEFEAGSSTIYYVTLEGAETWTVVKASSTGQLSVHQKLKKA